MGRNKKPIVIAFSGGCCSGKTTTLNAVKERLEKDGLKVLVFKADSHGYLEERGQTIDSIRRVASNYLRFQEFVCKQQWTFENEILRGLYDDNDVILLDRSLFDCLFYTIYYVNLSDESLQAGLHLRHYYDLQLMLYKHLQTAVDRVYNLTLYFAPLEEPKGKVTTYSRPNNLNMLKHIEGLGIHKLINDYYYDGLPAGSRKFINLNKTNVFETTESIIEVVKQFQAE